MRLRNDRSCFSMRTGPPWSKSTNFVRRPFGSSMSMWRKESAGSHVEGDHENWGLHEGLSGSRPGVEPDSCARSTYPPVAAPEGALRHLLPQAQAADARGPEPPHAGGLAWAAAHAGSPGSRVRTSASARRRSSPSQGCTPSPAVQSRAQQRWRAPAAPGSRPALRQPRQDGRVPPRLGRLPGGPCALPWPDFLE